MTTSPPAPSGPAPETSAGPLLRAVVLLERAPTGVGEVLGLLMPDVAAKIGGVPLPRLTVNLNGVPVTFEVVAEPLVARELDYAVSQSPLRDLVQTAVARHRGYLIVSVESGGDIFGAADLVANVAATYAGDANGLAVWLPDADHVTTDVMYAHEVDQRSAQVWFNTMAARLDETSAIAHTIGVRHLGGGDVQLRTTQLDPAGAHRALRGAVASLLEARALPAPGVAVIIAGVPHVLTPGQSVLGVGEILDAVPAAPAATAETPANQPKRRGWFGRRAESR